jgi:hypothetical protein
MVILCDLVCFVCWYHCESVGVRFQCALPLSPYLLWHVSLRFHLSLYSTSFVLVSVSIIHSGIALASAIAISASAAAVVAASTVSGVASAAIAASLARFANVACNLCVLLLLLATLSASAQCQGFSPRRGPALGVMGPRS